MMMLFKLTETIVDNTKANPGPIPSQPKRNHENHHRAKTKVNMVRYADDFVITANSEVLAIEIKNMISQFLSVRGLTLSDEKTTITHINDGFDFLGWTFRKFKSKLIIKPSNESTKPDSQVIHHHTERKQSQQSG